MTMLAEYGRLSLADVLGPAIQMADGYAIEGQLADTIEHQKTEIRIDWRGAILQIDQEPQTFSTRTSFAY
jgi:gamma-glutamyltranspeptidase